jgi:hypothetical protein
MSIIAVTRTRTGMDLMSANPSSLCVYLFHHNGLVFFYYKQKLLINKAKKSANHEPQKNIFGIKQSRGGNLHIKKTEREGFEPSMIELSYRRSRSTPSTTRTPFRQENLIAFPFVYEKNLRALFPCLKTMFVFKQTSFLRVAEF